jgi:protein-tyrosine-phosphatase
MLIENRVEGEWRVESAGTWGLDGDRAAPGSMAVMQGVGVDISDHRARSVSEELLREFDLVLTMENGQKEALRMEFPEYAERIYLISEMAGGKRDVEDPYGGPYSGYEQAAEEIQHYLDEGMQTILQLARDAASQN